MPRFKITLEYEGTQFSGWQYQKDHQTIQGKMYEACRKIFATDTIDLYGAGRTDSGVHALAQVAHLEVKTSLTNEQIKMRLNDELPAAINILKVENTHPKFHARHDAVARSYIYHISKRRTAFGKRYCWWIKDDLNVDIMKKAAKLFIGLKDFGSFGENEKEGGSTKVELKAINIHEFDESIVIQIVGSHFLWKMVRRIVGVLVEISRGNMSLEKVTGYLQKTSNEPARFTAPPSGLYLERVYYPGEEISYELKYLIKIS